MRRIATAAALALVASLTFTTSPAASSECAGDVYVRSYKITMEPSQSSYRLGERSEITLTLTHKQTGAPVPDTGIALGLYQPNGYDYDSGETDSSGRYVARVPLKSPPFQPGSVTASAYAEQKTGDSTFCAAVVEYGYKRQKDLFTIRK